MSTLVNLRRADHSDQIPSKTKEILEEYLSKAGYDGVTFDATLGPKKKGSSATFGVRTLRWKPNCVLLTVQPGDNGSRRNIYLIMKGGLRSRDVFERLLAYQREVENTPIPRDETKKAADTEKDHHQELTSTVETAPAISQNALPYLNIDKIDQNEDDVYLLLASMKKRAPDGKLSTWEISQVIRENLGLGDDPKRLNRQVTLRLLKKCYIEKIFGKTGKRAGKYLISSKGSELIDRFEKPASTVKLQEREEIIPTKETATPLSLADLVALKMELATQYLKVQNRLTEINSRKAVLAKEIHERTEEHETLLREENDILHRLKDSPGEQAALDLAKIRELLGK